MVFIRFQAHGWAYEQEDLCIELEGKQVKSNRKDSMKPLRWYCNKVGHIKADCYKQNCDQDTKDGCDTEDTDNAVIGNLEKNHSKQDLAPTSGNTAYARSGAIVPIVKEDSIMFKDKVPIIAPVGPVGANTVSVDSPGKCKESIYGGYRTVKLILVQHAPNVFQNLVLVSRCGNNGSLSCLLRKCL